MLSIFKRYWSKRKSNWTDIRKNQSLIPDWFVIFHFKILPTDKRYKDLSERQKVYLFRMYLDSPTPEQYKTWWDEKNPKSLYNAPDEGAVNIMEKWHGADAAKEFVKLGG